MYIAILFFLGLGTFILINGLDGERISDCMERAKNSTRDTKIGNFLIAFTYAFGILFPFYQILKRKALRARLNVHANIPMGSWWSRLSAAEKIAAVGVPIAALAAIGPLATTAKDLWGKNPSKIEPTWILFGLPGLSSHSCDQTFIIEHLTAATYCGIADLGWPTASA